MDDAQVIHDKCNQGPILVLTRTRYLPATHHSSVLQAELVQGTCLWVPFSFSPRLLVKFHLLNSKAQSWLFNSASSSAIYRLFTVVSCHFIIKFMWCPAWPFTYIKRVITSMLVLIISVYHIAHSISEESGYIATFAIVSQLNCTPAIRAFGVFKHEANRIRRLMIGYQKSCNS